MINEKYKYSELTSEIIGCAMTVHKELGNGFQEVIYQRALEVEFKHARIVFNREFEMPIFYKGEQIGTGRVDFFSRWCNIRRIKSDHKVRDIHFAQAINYLEAYDLEIGLLINFAERSLNFKRLNNKKFKQLPL